MALIWIWLESARLVDAELDQEIASPIGCDLSGVTGISNPSRLHAARTGSWGTVGPGDGCCSVELTARTVTVSDAAAGEDLEAEVAAAVGPLVVLLGQDGADQVRIASGTYLPAST